MWKMLTLRNRDSLNDANAQLTEQGYWGELGGEAIPEIKTKRKSEYSPELRGLIRRYLRTDPSRRPTPQELYDATETQVRSRAAGAKDRATGLKSGKRVYYMGNEINDMLVNGDIPAGGGGTTCGYIPYRRQGLSMFNKRKFKDPDL